ncbi:MAG TPA: hypothetical protein VGN61_09440 [Verrucomicrobiae bacterium]
MPATETHWLAPAVYPALIAFVCAVVVFLWRKFLEVRSVNRAVLAEIQRLIKVVKIHRSWWKGRMDKEDTDYPLIPFSHPVYDKQVQNIGSLNGAVVVRAVRLYGYMDFLNSMQDSRLAHVKAGKADEFNTMYLGVLDKFLSQFETTFDKEFEGLH